MSGPLRWDVEGRDWPHREASRFVPVGRLVWHVQQTGSGPTILLLHGTGAATHSWRGVMPLLAEELTVIAPDLPGHGFTRGRPAGGLTLTGMARAIGDLLDETGMVPALVAGHSAGAAIALQLLHERGAGVPLVGFNAAIMPFPGLAARIAPALAKTLFVNPFAPRIFAHMASIPGETERFLKRSTGSRIDAAGLAAYRTLFTNSRHCEGALAMMANWDLDRLKRLLPRISNPVHLVHSRGDTAVPLSSVEQACALLPECQLEVLAGLGHLAHEEAPDQALRIIRAVAAQRGVGAAEVPTP